MLFAFFLLILLFNGSQFLTALLSIFVYHALCSYLLCEICSVFSHYLIFLRHCIIQAYGRRVHFYSQYVLPFRLLDGLFGC